MRTKKKILFLFLLLCFVISGGVYLWGVKSGSYPEYWEEWTRAPEPKQQYSTIAPHEVKIVIPDDVPYSLHMSSTPETALDFQPGQYIQTENQKRVRLPLNSDGSNYKHLKKFIDIGIIPDQTDIAVNQLVDYFQYPYPYEATEDDEDFSTNAHIFPCPWNKRNWLLHIGMQTRPAPPIMDKPLHLILVMDVSGSMLSASKIPFFLNGLYDFFDKLDEDSYLSVVLYGGAAGVSLDYVSVKNRDKIKQAFDTLHSSGTTEYGRGMSAAVSLAEKYQSKDMATRIALITDGDLNADMPDKGAVFDMFKHIGEKEYTAHILALSAPHINDKAMILLASSAGGFARHVKSSWQAEQALNDMYRHTIYPIARDAKAFMELNPQAIEVFRFISHYPVSQKNNADHVGVVIENNQQMTWLFEITPKEGFTTPDSGLLGQFVFLYKPLDKAIASDQDIVFPIQESHIIHKLDQVPYPLRFISGVAGFGYLLSGDLPPEHFTFDDVLDLAYMPPEQQTDKNKDMFIDLVLKTKLLKEYQTDRERGIMH